MNVADVYSQIANRALHEEKEAKDAALQQDIALALQEKQQETDLWLAHPLTIQFVGALVAFANKLNEEAKEQAHSTSEVSSQLMRTKLIESTTIQEILSYARTNNCRYNTTQRVASNSGR